MQKDCCSKGECCEYEKNVHRGESFNYENFKWCQCNTGALISFQQSSTIIWSTGTFFDHSQTINDINNFTFDTQTTANTVNAKTISVVGFGGKNAVTDPKIIKILLDAIKTLNPNIFVAVDIFEDMAKHGGLENYQKVNGDSFATERDVADYIKATGTIRFKGTVVNFAGYVLLDNIEFYTKFKGSLCNCVSDNFLNNLCSYTFDDPNSTLFNNSFFKLDTCDPDKALERMVR